MQAPDMLTFEEFCNENKITITDGMKLFTRSKVIKDPTNLPYLGEGLHQPPFNFWTNESTTPDTIEISQLVASECQRRIVEAPYAVRESLQRRYQEREIFRSRRMYLFPYLNKTLAIYGKVTGYKKLKNRDYWISFCLSPLRELGSDIFMADHQWFDVPMETYDKLGIVKYGDHLAVEGVVREYKRYDVGLKGWSSYVDYGIRADRISTYRNDTPWVEVERTYQYKPTHYIPSFDEGGYSKD